MSEQKDPTEFLVSLHSPDPNHGLRSQHRASKTKRLPKWRSMILFAVVTGTYISACVVRATFQNEALSNIAKEPYATHLLSDDFNWYALTPSEDINWVPCFNGHKCARLSLPLDYLTEHDGGPKTEVALRMIPAMDKENYLGPILVNPGGPGRPGTQFIASYGKSLSAIVGPRFDILGFDPRGAGATTPSAQCFDTESQKAIWDLQQGYLTSGLNVTDGSIPYSRARAKVVGEKCAQALGGNGVEVRNGNASDWGPARFMGTPNVATDMLRITQKMGFEKVQYIGYSYGTVLGQYFSAMYPDKIGRVVIDGVQDGEDYRQGAWATNLKDTDAVFDSFAKFCHLAGPLKCKIHESTVSGVQSRIDTIRKTLVSSPIPVPFSENGPFVFTEAMLIGEMFSALYSPLLAYPRLADIILAVEARNTSVIAATVGQRFPYGCECGRAKLPWQLNNKDQVSAAIVCGDGAHTPFDQSTFEKYLANLTAQSSLAGPLWAGIRLSCYEWPIQAKWKFEEPLAANETSHPILILSPSYDPVCPISSARRVQGRYKGAGLLEQRSYGHCTTAAPSLCTAKHLREYFVNGTLPEEGTVCEADAMPFEGSMVRALSAEDQELFEALEDLTNMIPQFDLKS